jgi:glycosyltransferase involved in cell wall biosynthesis
MAVYNGGAFLRTAIDSILQQTYSNFRFLIVDDASTDDTRETVRSYQDERIELLCLDRNVGQTAALNAGLRHASTPWIARMDADDYSAPTRLEEQMAALDSDPSLSCLGTFAWTFSDEPSNPDGVVTTPVTYEEIQRVLLGSPLIHGSIIISREALLDVGSYNDRYRYCADVEMYDRFLPRYKAAAISRQLLGVRRHVGQGSNTKVAFEEAIEISAHRLATADYSAKDAAVVRGSLSRAHLSHARFLAQEVKFAGIMRDLLAALRVSPKTFLYDCFIVFLVYNVPVRARGKILRVLSGLPLPLRRYIKRPSKHYFKAE